MKDKVVLISFFKSENLGDKELSKGLINIVKKKYNIMYKYDFSTMIKIEELDECSEHPTENSKIKNYFKKVIPLLIGSENYKKLAYHQTVKKRMKTLMFNDILKADKIIIGGGNMLMDKDKTWPLRINEIVNFSNKNDIKVNIVYVGVGPIKNEYTKLLYKNIFKKVDKLIVRDNNSKRLLIPLTGSKSVEVGYDPALYYDEKLYNQRAKLLKNNDKPVVGLNVLGQECFKSSTQNLNYLKEMEILIEKLNKDSYKEIVIFSTAMNDYENIKNLMLKIKNKNVIRYEVNTYTDIARLYSRLNFLIGSRMHSLIFAQSHFLPYMAFSWQDKVDSYAEMINLNIKVIDVKKISKNVDLIENTINEEWNDLQKIEQIRIKNLQIENSREHLAI